MTTPLTPPVCSWCHRPPTSSHRPNCPRPDEVFTAFDLRKSREETATLDRERHERVDPDPGPLSTKVRRYLRDRIEGRGFTDGSMAGVLDIIDAWERRERVDPDPGLREAAQRLVDAIADEAAVKGLARAGMPQGWKAEMDAESALLCALQDTRTALDGRDRSHQHVAKETSNG
jgi:hypothetical protein